MVLLLPTDLFPWLRLQLAATKRIDPLNWNNFGHDLDYGSFCFGLAPVFNALVFWLVLFISDLKFQLCPKATESKFSETPNMGWSGRVGGEARWVRRPVKEKIRWEERFFFSSSSSECFSIISAASINAVETKSLNCFKGWDIPARQFRGGRSSGGRWEKEKVNPKTAKDTCSGK